MLQQVDSVHMFKQYDVVKGCGAFIFSGKIICSVSNTTYIGNQH